MNTLLSLLENPIFLVVWCACAIPFWRAMTGHVAWRIHTTAKHPSGVSPEIEDWVWGAFLTAFVALPFWWLVAIFHSAPKAWKTQIERESEDMARMIRNDRQLVAQAQRLKELDKGDRNDDN